jgi:hypothetical protein
MYSFYPLSNYPSEIQYYVSRDLNSEWGVDFYIIINKVTFYTAPYLAKRLVVVFILMELLINGITYNNVYKIYRNYDFKDNILSFIYNKSDGIIQVVFPNGETLSKIK